VLGQFQPKKWIGPISAQKLIFSSGPDPAQKAGLGQDQPGPSTRLAGPEQVWPSTRNQRGELFSPHPPACRTNVLHAEGNAGHGNNMRGKERLPGAEEAVALGLLLLPEAVLWRRPVAVSSGVVVPTTAPSGATVSHGAATFFPDCSCVFSRSLAVSSFPSSRCWVFGVSPLFRLIFSPILSFRFFFLRVISLFFSVFFLFFLLSVSLFFSVLPPRLLFFLVFFSPSVLFSPLHCCCVDCYL